MAETPVPVLDFAGSCPDCGQRQVTLPATEPVLGDDFNWHARDFDSLRVAMIEELAARFPEHTRWTVADLEVVLVEALATALDQLHDMADRVAAEAYLETARRPESVRRLLGLIGYDAAAEALLADLVQDGVLTTKEQRLEQLWSANPALMEEARRLGPLSIHRQRRMVTEADYGVRLEEHPIVARAAAGSAWTGSWMTLRVAVVLRKVGTGLDDAFDYDEDIAEAVRRFHAQRGLYLPDLSDASCRMILDPVVGAYRMVGQEVELDDAIPVGIAIEITLGVGANYFQSEVRRAVNDALGTQVGGFFEPGRLHFGEDLHAGDIYQELLGLDGVERVCLTLFKRIGSQYRDMSEAGTISLSGLEIAVCDNDPRRPQRGYYRLTLTGGRRG